MRRQQVAMEFMRDRSSHKSKNNSNRISRLGVCVENSKKSGEGGQEGASRVSVNSGQG